MKNYKFVEKRFDFDENISIPEGSVILSVESRMITYGRDNSDPKNPKEYIYDPGGYYVKYLNPVE